jgi:alpha-L-fucosidase
MLERVPSDRPTPQQAAWADLERGMFIHYGLFAYTGVFRGIRWVREGANPLYSQSMVPVDPKVFKPTALDAGQWVAAAKSAGMKYLVFTAKHHDGFCLWPTATNDYSVKSSDWRGGRGDVVKEVAAACRAQGIHFGFYLSPWDAYAWQVLKLDDAAYDKYYMQQLTELLTYYGPVVEICWDGAGAKYRRHDWIKYFRLVKSLQPDTLLAWSGPSEIRWVWEDEEGGTAPDPLWNVVHISEHPENGDPTVLWPEEYRGKDYWWPAQAYTPVDTFWSGATKLPFGHKQDTVKPIKALVDIYHASVGHGANLVINFVPNQRGLLNEVEVARVWKLHEIIRHTYANDLLPGHPIAASSVSGPEHRPSRATDADPNTRWQAADGVQDAWLEVDMGRSVTFGRAVMQEAIGCGQRVRSYRVLWWDGSGWQQASNGTSIGHKKIDVFPKLTARKVRLHITASTGAPTVRYFGLYD